MLKPKLEPYDLCRQVSHSRGIVSPNQRVLTTLCVVLFVVGIFAAAGGVVQSRRNATMTASIKRASVGEQATIAASNAQMAGIARDRESASAYVAYMGKGVNFQTVLDSLCDAFASEGGVNAELDRVDMAFLDSGKLEVSASIMGGNQSVAAAICQSFFKSMDGQGWSFTKNTPTTIPNGIQTRMVFIRSEKEKGQ